MIKRVKYWLVFKICCSLHCFIISDERGIESAVGKTEQDIK